MTDDCASERTPARVVLDPGPGESIASLAADPERFAAQREALRRYCFSFLRNADDAEDAVQLTLERALRYRPAQTDQGRWLVAIARNVCRDIVSSRASSELPLDRDGEAFDRGLRPDPEHEVATRHALARALDVLTPTERRAVGASWLLDQTSYDAARSVGIAHQTLRVHLARARKKLALYLDEAERATAGFVPWLLDLPQRASRRAAAAASRDASWTDRAVAFSAPAVVLAVTLASVAVVARHGGTPVAAGGGTAQFAPFSMPRSFDAGGREPAPASGGSAASSGGGGIMRGLQSILSPQRPQDARVVDVEPSPNYPQDHTLYAAASDSGCQALTTCGELFVSRNGGHTWTNLGTAGLQPDAHLLLPATSYAHNTFYAFGAGGLQITTNGGYDFRTLVPDLPGYAGLMPPGGSSYVSVANVDLWDFATQSNPGLVTAYLPGLSASGAALAVPRGGGWAFLQPVTTPAGAQPEQVLACAASACTTGAALPWAAGTTTLSASTDGSTVLAVSPSGLAVSRDGGASFTSVSAPEGATPVQGVVAQGPAGSPRILLIGKNEATGSWRLSASDDFGATWLVVPVSGGMAGILAVASPGQLVLEVQKADYGTVAGYRCSADGGGSWSAC